MQRRRRQPGQKRIRRISKGKFGRLRKEIQHIILRRTEAGTEYWEYEEWTEHPLGATIFGAGGQYWRDRTSGRPEPSISAVHRLLAEAGIDHQILRIA